MNPSLHCRDIECDSGKGTSSSFEKVSRAMAYDAASSEGAPCSSQFRNTADVCARRQSERMSSAIARIDPLGASWVRQRSNSHPS